MRLKTQLAELKFMPDNVLFLDRRYPSIGLLYELQHRSIGFCMRLKYNWRKAIHAMPVEKETIKIVNFKLP